MGRASPKKVHRYSLEFKRRAADAWSLVRQAKLGAFCRVRVPAREGLTTHLYRVLQWWRKFYMD